MIGAASGRFDLVWLFILPMPVFFWGVHYWERLQNAQRAIFTGAMLAVIVLFGLFSLQIILANRQIKPEWDLKALWLFARLAVRGQNFYDIELVRHFAYLYGPPSQLLLEQISFPYPPPTMLLIAPMGWFEMETAFPLWQGLHLLFLGGALVLLWRRFLGESAWRGMALAVILVAGLHPTMDTLYSGQTNFLVLLLLLLFGRDQDRRRGGLWLGLALFVKPFMAVVLLYVVLRRQWHIIAGLIITLIGASLAAALIFGPAVFVHYLTDSSLFSSYGTYRITMPFNQSLLAVLMRLIHADLGQVSPFTHPLYLAIAGFFTAVTAIWVYGLGDKNREWGLALTVVLALLIYPHSLIYYMVLLIVPLALIWSQRQLWPESPGRIIGFIVLESLLLSSPGEGVFFATLLCWCALLLVSGRQFGLFKASN